MECHARGGRGVPGPPTGGGPRGGVDLEPARVGRLLGAVHRASARPRARVAGRPDRCLVRRTRGDASARGSPGAFEHRPVAGSHVLGPQDEARSRRRDGWRRRPLGHRGGHRGRVAGVAADRRASPSRPATPPAPCCSTSRPWSGTRSCWISSACRSASCRRFVRPTAASAAPSKLGGIPAGVPVVAVLADSHAALYFHGCTAPGTGKVTYGTGSSVMTPVAAPGERAGRDRHDPGLAGRRRADVRPGGQHPGERLGSGLDCRHAGLAR